MAVGAGEWSLARASIVPSCSKAGEALCWQAETGCGDGSPQAFVAFAELHNLLLDVAQIERLTSDSQVQTSI